MHKGHNDIINFQKKDLIKPFRQLTSHFRIESFGKSARVRQSFQAAQFNCLNGLTSCRNCRREILVAFWFKHGLRSNFMAPNCKTVS